MFAVRDFPVLKLVIQTLPVKAGALLQITMNTNFTDLGLRSELIEGIRRLGFETPSPIQAQTIPLALEGKDIVGLSQTGSGKTAAFALPALNQVDVAQKETQVIVICPTRELAVQVCEEINRLGSAMKDLIAVPVYGGAPIDRQIRALRKGAHIVVGTPGRVMDHLRRKTLNTKAIRICILDEADRMLDMGFREDMEIILDELPEVHQTLFFSATMNREVKSLIQAYSSEAEQVSIERKALTVDTIEQTYYEVRNRSKIEVLCRILDMEISPRGIVFCNTKQMVETATEALVARGYACDRIHGDITQNNRERVIRKFKDGSIELLIATDVAARGLDIDQLSRKHQRDIYRLEAIERYTRQVVRRMPVPSLEDVEGRKENKAFEQVRDLLEEGTYKRYDALVDRLLDAGHTPTDITSALFSLLNKNEDSLSEQIVEDTEPYRDTPQSIDRGKKNNRNRGKGNYRKRTSKPKKKSERRFKRPKQ